MTKDFPYLAMDSAGERTILCDRPQDGCFIGGISRKERVYARDDTSKEKRMTRKMLSNDQLSHYVGMSIKNPVAANRYWARCMGQDATMDDETVEKLKSFLQSKLHPSDHAAACALMDGGAAQDTEPYLSDPEEKPMGKLAGDAKARADFFKHYPDAARIAIDNSGIPIPSRPANPRVAMDAAGAASFAAMFPGLAKIRCL